MRQLTNEQKASVLDELTARFRSRMAREIGESVICAGDLLNITFELTLLVSRETNGELHCVCKPTEATH